MCVCVALYKVYHLIFHHFVLSDAVSQAGRISKQGIISMLSGSKVLNSDRLGAMHRATFALCNINARASL